MNEISEEARNAVRKAFNISEAFPDDKFDRYYRLHVEMAQSAIDSATKPRDARIKELEGQVFKFKSALEDAYSLLHEINLSNYNEVDVEELNTSSVAASLLIRAVLTPVDPHSLEQKGGK